MQTYLPSNQFIARVLVLVALFLVIFGSYKLVIYFKHRSQTTTATDLVISPEIIQKDSNKNGIPDWEESLWGLDPAINGQSNKEFILAKRESLKKENGVAVTSDEPVSENDALSREFFAVVMSLQQSGNLDENTLRAVSDTVGKKIVADPLPAIYTKSMIITRPSDDIEKLKYYTDYLNLNVKYKDRNIGNELTFIAAALKNNDPGALKLVTAIGSSYRSFGKDLMKIPVTPALADIHVSLANNYERVAVSIGGLSKLLTEPITGMKGLINYKKYSDLLIEDIGKLTDNFS